MEDIQPTGSVASSGGTPVTATTSSSSQKQNTPNVPTSSETLSLSQGGNTSSSTTTIDTLVELTSQQDATSTPSDKFDWVKVTKDKTYRIAIPLTSLNGTSQEEKLACAHAVLPANT